MYIMFALGQSSVCIHPREQLRMCLTLQPSDVVFEPQSNQSSDSQCEAWCRILAHELKVDLGAWVVMLICIEHAGLSPSLSLIPYLSDRCGGRMQVGEHP